MNPRSSSVKILALAVALAMSVSTTLQAAGDAPLGCVESYARLPKASNHLAQMRAGDLQAWDTWTRGMMQTGFSLPEAHAMAALIAEQPIPLQAHVLRLLRDHYPQLTKKQTLHFPPRAAADVMISAMLKPERIFAQAMQQHRDPEIALRSYFEAMKRALPSHQSALGVNEMKEVAQLIQRELRKVQRAQPFPRPQVRLMGSGPNGLAMDGTSDLDILVTDQTRYALSSSDLILKVNQMLQKRFGRAGLEGIQQVNVDNIATAEALTLPKAVQFFIAPDRVEIHVFPRPRADLPAKEQKPDIYTWFTSTRPAR